MEELYLCENCGQLIENKYWCKQCGDAVKHDDLPDEQETQKEKEEYEWTAI